MERIKASKDCRPSEEVIQKKVNEFLQWKETDTPEEYKKIVIRFGNIMNGTSDRIATNKVYKNWTKDDFKKVLAGIDSDEEFKLEEEPNKIKEALDRAGKNSDAQKIGLLKGVVNKLSKALKRMQK